MRLIFALISDSTEYVEVMTAVKDLLKIRVAPEGAVRSYDIDEDVFAAVKIFEIQDVWELMGRAAGARARSKRAPLNVEPTLWILNPLMPKYEDLPCVQRKMGESIRDFAMRQFDTGLTCPTDDEVRALGFELVRKSDFERKIEAAVPFAAHLRTERLAVEALKRTAGTSEEARLEYEGADAALCDKASEHWERLSPPAKVIMKARAFDLSYDRDTDDLDTMYLIGDVRHDVKRSRVG